MLCCDTHNAVIGEAPARSAYADGVAGVILKRPCVERFTGIIHCTLLLCCETHNAVIGEAPARSAYVDGVAGVILCLVLLACVKRHRVRVPPLKDSLGITPMASTRHIICTIQHHLHTDKVQRTRDTCTVSIDARIQHVTDAHICVSMMMASHALRNDAHAQGVNGRRAAQEQTGT